MSGTVRHRSERHSLVRTGAEVRSLAALGESASTSRVLNLSHIFKTLKQEPDYHKHPFFQDARLNRGIILKHTLRGNETGIFSQARRTATKIILPFDPEDLRSGGASIFVNEAGFERFCREFFINSTNSVQDIELLRLLDGIPSLDPFLVREFLSRNGYKPAVCYLKISPADVQNMVAFAVSEIERLVKVAFGNGPDTATAKFAGKVLSNEMDKDLVPLQQTLRLNDASFSEGIFSWRGFLYYKWRYLELRARMEKVIEGIMMYRPRDFPEKAVESYLKESRPEICSSILKITEAIGRNLKIYDQAYGALVDRQEPAQFRQFLLDGPKLFYELGERVAILDHIGSFWAYRISGTKSGRITSLEYSDILMNFEDCLEYQDEDEDELVC
ncbi:hypothetical protein MMA231_01675 [Asticcacaulis sp. MM231]|uniref:hypothetical protein n=1 Tax=Asticcacaulis sp. MM231 TaxID=3157666 RepID=UPI0032D58123